MEKHKDIESTIEGNKILAIYMEYKQIKPYIYELPINKANNMLPRHVFVGDNSNSFKFDSDWNWSMEVYKKIINQCTDNTNENLHILIIDIEDELLQGNKQEFFLALVEVVQFLNNKDGEIIRK